MVLAGKNGGEGKSFFLRPLLQVFGEDDVFSNPPRSNFPLVDLPGKKVVFLDDWRLNETIVSYADQGLWFEGAGLPIARPQNTPGAKGHLMYRGSAPILMTTGLENVESLRRLAEAEGAGHDENASMMMRRLKVFNFTTALPKPTCKINYCKRCFATMLFTETAAYF